MAQLCITADDYGMHGTVNAAIEELAAKRDISAVAIMVHDEAVLDSLDKLRGTGVAVGLHLVLTQERPVLSSLYGTPLAPNGKLLATPYALIRVLLRNLRLRALLLDELRAQVARYLSLGLPLSFVNSHEHTHEAPLLWGLVANVVEKNRPPALRSAHVQPLSISSRGALSVLSRISRRLHPLRYPVQILSPLGAGQAGEMTLSKVGTFAENGVAWHGHTDILSRWA